MTHPSDPLRRRVERAAGPLVVLLARLPRAVPFLAVLVLLVAGLVLRGAAGAGLLLALAALLGLLLFLSWPRLEGQSRLLRLLVLTLLVGRAVTFLV